VLEQISAVNLFVAEISIGTIAIGGILVVRGTRLNRLAIRPQWFALGLLDPGATFLLFDFGLGHTSATHAAFLLGTDALATVALAAVFLRERIGPAMWLALAATIAGSTVIAEQRGGDASVLGDLLVVGASLAAAAYAVVARSSTKDADPFAVTGVQMVGAGVIASVLGLFSSPGAGPQVVHADVTHLAALVAVALLGTVIPFILYTRAIAHVSASASGIILGLVPLFGAAAAVVLVGERIGPGQAAGGSLVVVAAIIAARGSVGEPLG
jgi:drug/metabolite transporter (DMT)-like permease